MAQPSRQYHAGYWYHVYARGQRGDPLFLDDEDRQQYLETLDEVLVRRGAHLGAFCLMTNHTHLLLRMGEVPLSRILQGVHMSYARYFNYERGNHGHVFQGRPGVKIVLDDAYLLQLIPYIHNNPVEAGMAEEPSAYRWSSDVLYRGDSREDFELRSFRFPPGFRGEDRTQVYRERLGESPSKLEGGQSYVGTEEEWNELERRREERSDRFRDRRGRRVKDAIAREVLAETEWTIEDLRAPGRAQPQARLRQQAMVRMYGEGYGPREIADYFRRSKGTVSYAVRKFEEE